MGMLWNKISLDQRVWIAGVSVCDAGRVPGLEYAVGFELRFGVPVMALETAATYCLSFTCAMSGLSEQSTVTGSGISDSQLPSEFRVL